METAKEWLTSLTKIAVGVLLGVAVMQRWPSGISLVAVVVYALLAAWVVYAYVWAAMTDAAAWAAMTDRQWRSEDAEATTEAPVRPVTADELVAIRIGLMEIPHRQLTARCLGCHHYLIHTVDGWTHLAVEDTHPAVPASAEVPS